MDECLGHHRPHCASDAVGVKIRPSASREVVMTIDEHFKERVVKEVE